MVIRRFLKDRRSVKGCSGIVKLVSEWLDLIAGLECWGTAISASHQSLWHSQAAKRPMHVAVGHRPTEQDKAKNEAVKRRQQFPDNDQATNDCGRRFTADG
jgi:hypothetical protein